MEKLSREVRTNRKPEYDIHPIILGRWSPRAMTGEKLSDEEIMPLFEAARWAPSAFNSQVWRFLYAKRDTKYWKTYFSLLTDWNKKWCKNAAVLVAVISRKRFEYNNKPSRTHAFDAGAAWENLAIEGTRRGLVVHAMSGFDYKKGKKELDVPDDYEIQAMIAIGKRGIRDTLPEEMKKIEFPNDRRPLREIMIKGKFKEK